MYKQELSIEDESNNSERLFSFSIVIYLWFGMFSDCCPSQLLYISL